MLKKRQRKELSPPLSNLPSSVSTSFLIQKGEQSGNVERSNLALRRRRSGSRDGQRFNLGNVHVLSRYVLVFDVYNMRFNKFFA
jgi:hypothetical protein